MRTHPRVSRSVIPGRRTAWRFGILIGSSSGDSRTGRSGSRRRSPASGAASRSGTPSASFASSSTGSSVLLNRIVHGGATGNSRVNRDRVRDGAALLAFLMPVFADVMMDNPHEDRGRPFYPVVE